MRNTTLLLFIYPHCVFFKILFCPFLKFEISGNCVIVMSVCTDAVFVAVLCSKVEAVAVRDLALFHTATACVIHAQAAAVQH